MKKGPKYQKRVRRGRRLGDVWVVPPYEAAVEAHIREKTDYWETTLGVVTLYPTPSTSEARQNRKARRAHLQ